MLIRQGTPLYLQWPRRDQAGIALVVTLSLVVLATVAIVAFFTRTTTNQQITAGSAQSMIATTFADGATQEIIGNLQQEMWATSGKPNASPPVFPMTSVAGSIPSRVVRASATGGGPGDPTLAAVPVFSPGATPDSNADYSLFGNLVKQSLNSQPFYTSADISGKTVTGTQTASAVHTTNAAANGRIHNGVYWNQPQLISTSDPAKISALVPDWVYTDRSGSHPTAYGTGMEPSTSGALNPKGIIGRYAYNIYDIGGLLNANVAGYGAGVTALPASTDKGTMIVPGYKGSALMADLSGLALGGTLTANGATAASLSNWQAKLPTLRYRLAWSGDGFAKVFASGQYAGWIQTFFGQYDPKTDIAAPANTTTLTNYNFLSRQDLITWITSQWGSGSSGSASATWILPYLTHFSYDTDAPSFAPDPNRPRSNVALGPSGGNDSSSSLDDQVNVGFTPTLDASGNTVKAVLDVNNYPLVKRRFPLSALSLLDNVYPNRPPAAALVDQIRYDFGLIWDPVNNCWFYQVPEENTPSTTIKKLGDVAALAGSQLRSPNFFELLKAAIAAGSLGKQWGGGGYDQDPDNALVPSGPSKPGRYSSVNLQILQIGANIISQSTTNYAPTTINLGGKIGALPHTSLITPGPLGSTVYGVKDLPYFYRTRLLSSLIGRFSHKSMYESTYSKSNSYLCAYTVAPELWNPHAPNPYVSTANYPVSFRVVPDTFGYPVYGSCAFYTGPALSKTYPLGPRNWAIGGISPGNGPDSGDYSALGGPDCKTHQISYDGSSNVYIQFGRDLTHTDLLPSAALPAPLGSFRNPCPLIAENFPPNINLVGRPDTNPTGMQPGTAMFDGQPNTVLTTTSNAIPYKFASQGFFNANTLGFLLGYYCSGTYTTTDPGKFTFYDAAIHGNTTLPMAMYLQYSLDGSNYYTYDVIPCAFPSGQGGLTPPSGVQQTQTGVRADPRTHRWGFVWSAIPNGSGTYGVKPIASTTYDVQAGLTFTPTNDLTALNYGTGGTPWKNNPKAPGWSGALGYDLVQPSGQSNIALGWTQVNQNSSSQSGATQTSGGYYKDPDGVIRRADGAWWNNSNSYGLPEVMTQMASNSTGTANYDSRPAVLNRPFQSVAELGNVFRDTPWRSLDFFTPESADAALLDIFCVYGPDPYSYKGTLTTESGLVAGKVSLNTRQIPVLAALLKGTAIAPSAPLSSSSALTTLNDAQATAVAKALVQWTTNTNSTQGQGPLRNPSELVGKLVSGTTSSPVYNGFSKQLSDSAVLPATPASALSELQEIKMQRECVLHALGDTGTTRTWNLLIDLVAQTGQLTPNPTVGSNSNALQNFVVGGERHVWVSVALDRVTGRILKMQVEPVRL